MAECRALQESNRMDLLIFPNQLFENHPGLNHHLDRIVFIEDSLFFGDPFYPESFHQQKLWLLRTSMKRFEEKLSKQGHRTIYLDHSTDRRTLGDLLAQQVKKNSKPKWITVNPVDFMLEKRLRRAADHLGADIQFLHNPGFLNSREENQKYRADRKRWFMADFYKWQRRRLNILIEDDQPVGGQWSFDNDNRKKVPKKLLGKIPSLNFPKIDKHGKESRARIEKTYKKNPGTLEQLIYPTSHEEASDWLDQFLQTRFDHFGDYEDSIEKDESFLWHSVLTPSLNIGLITPEQVLSRVMEFQSHSNVPLNSLEGFVRQLIGWREFMRATYEDLGVRMRNSNNWEHQRPLSPCFYDGSTGILPLDNCIKRIHTTGYCHHIERLMVLGGFMFLCEIEPNAIYRWFMEMFIDSYDWVMVPNVYAMSQHADGGLITTKPYFSGSSYIRKMSHYKQDNWCDVWDGLYWRWIWKNKSKLSANPRWAMMCSMVDKMEDAKRKRHIKNAENFLAGLN